MPVADFYENSTVNFTIQITQDRANPDVTADTITYIVKSAKSDPDASAVIDVDAVSLTADGKGTFNLTPVITADIPGNYFQEIIWHTAGGAIYVLDSAALKILDKVQDNV